MNIHCQGNYGHIIIEADGSHPFTVISEIGAGLTNCLLLTLAGRLGMDRLDI